MCARACLGSCGGCSAAPKQAAVRPSCCSKPTRPQCTLVHACATCRQLCGQGRAPSGGELRVFGSRSAGAHRKRAGESSAHAIHACMPVPADDVLARRAGRGARTRRHAHSRRPSMRWIVFRVRVGAVLQGHAPATSATAGLSLPGARQGGRAERGGGEGAHARAQRGGRAGGGGAPQARRRQEGAARGGQGARRRRGQGARGRAGQGGPPAGWSEG